MNFERGKNPITAIGAGISDQAFTVTEFWVTVLEVGEGEPPYESLPIGRYFRSNNQRNYEVGTSGHLFLKAAIKGDDKKIGELLGDFQKYYARNISLHFGFFFKGYTGSKFKKEIDMDPGSKIFYKDLEGCIVNLNDELIEIPEGRLIPNSDFQIVLRGTKEENFDVEL